MAACVSNEGYREAACYDNVLSNSGGAYAADGHHTPAPWPMPESTPIYWQPDMDNQGQYSNGGGSLEWPGPQHGWTSIGDWGSANGNGDGTRGNVAGCPKRRFCTSYPDVGLCRRGQQCAFAHSREEISVPLLDVSEENQDPASLTDEFFMYKYKTRWCPVGVQHEWHTCVYAHNYQDARRPISIGYGARLCPYWSKKDTGAEYSQRCPLGLRCPYAHGAKEQLYHPHYFKTVICRDLRGRVCPRQGLCAFYHNKQERRIPPYDGVDYTKPLQNEALPSDWIAEFLTPPFIPEVNGTGGGGCGEDGGVISETDGNTGSFVQYAQMPADGGQGQYVMCGPGQSPMMYFMPVSQMMPSPMLAAQPSPWGQFVPVDSNGGGASPMRGNDDTNGNGPMSPMNMQTNSSLHHDDDGASPRF